MDSGSLSRQLEQLPASGLVLEIRASKKLLSLYLLFMLCLASAIGILQVPGSYKLALLSISFLVAIKILRRHVLFTHPDSIAKLVITELGWCLVQLNNGQIEKLAILPQSCLTSGLVVMSLGQQQAGLQWQTRSLVLNAEMLGSDHFRQLKRQLIINPATVKMNS